MGVRERILSFLQLWGEVLTHPIRAWSNSQALSELHDALEAEFARFCAGRGLEPDDDAHAAWWDHVAEVTDAFAAARGLDPEAEETSAALETAWAEFETWCLEEGRAPYAAGQFSVWLASSSSV